jgi:acyl carrier protein
MQIRATFQNKAVRLAKDSGLSLKDEHSKATPVLRLLSGGSMRARVFQEDCSMTERFEATVREFIAENFLFRADAEISNDQSLLESGVIDSTGVLELIAFLEQTYRITVADEDIVPENLDSIDNMMRYLAAKLPAAA